VFPVGICSERPLKKPARMGVDGFAETEGNDESEESEDRPDPREGCPDGTKGPGPAVPLGSWSLSRMVISSFDRRGASMICGDGHSLGVLPPSDSERVRDVAVPGADVDAGPAACVACVSWDSVTATSLSGSIGP